MTARGRLLAGLVLVAIAAGLVPQLVRAGYSTDEEFTLFAVRGIQAAGLPLLPSRLLYDRGIVYSYAAWLAGAFTTPSLVASRVVSWAAALGALLALHALVRDVASPRAAGLAAALVAASLPFVAVATTARFYAPFLLLYLLALRALARYASDAPPGSLALAGLFGLSLLARGTHELAFTLAAVPLAALLLSPRARRGAWAAASVAVVAGLAVAQLSLVALHQLPSAVSVEPTQTSAASAPAAGQAPSTADPAHPAAASTASQRRADSSSPPSMLQRFFVWQVVNLVEWPLDPLDFFRHVAGVMPGLVIGVLGLLVLRVLGLGAPWSGPQRFAHLLWIGWVLFFGVIDSGITINYLLVPVTLMLTALAIDLAALVPGRHFAGVAALLVVVMAVEQWGGPAHAGARLDAARPTLQAPPGMSLPALAAAAERVACTDELACLLLAGRVDRWLALDDFLRTRFIVLRGGREVGVYAGRPVARALPDLFAAAEGEPSPASVLVIDVFKDLPVGPSERFLDRALAESSIPARTVWQDATMRVVELGSADRARERQDR